jgi:hypothetical protein
MALRALKHLEHAIIRPYTIQPSQQVVLGMTCVFGTLDTAVQAAAGASDLVIGVVRLDGVNAGYADASNIITPAYLPQPTTTTIEVVLMFSAIVPMTVGTGGSTRGKKQIVVSTGVTDAPANPGADTTDIEIIGVALQTGVAGDVIGIGIGLNSRTN